MLEKKEEENKINEKTNRISSNSNWSIRWNAISEEMDKYIDIAWTQTVYEIARTFESQMFRIKNQKRNKYIYSTHVQNENRFNSKHYSK